MCFPNKSSHVKKIIKNTLIKPINSLENAERETQNEYEKKNIYKIKTFVIENKTNTTVQLRNRHSNEADC